MLNIVNVYYVTGMGSLYAVWYKYQRVTSSVLRLLVVRENGGKELEVVSHRVLEAFISVYFSFRYFIERVRILLG